MMIKRVLVPLDGSGFAETALVAALDVGRRARASLHLVAAMEEVPEWTLPAAPASLAEWRVPYFERLLETLSGEGGAPELTTGMPLGPIPDELESEATRIDADLVVMATHGRGPLSRAWLGSVADAFVRRTRRPVLMIRPHEGEEGSVPWRGARRIVVALDGSPLAEAALVAALELGRLFDATYRLVRVVHFPIGPASPYIPDAAQFNEESVAAEQKVATEYLDTVRGRLQAEGLSVEISTPVAVQVARGLLADAAEAGCDVIAMATHGSRLRRLALGSSADKVLRASDLPVLLVRPGGEDGDEPEGR